MPSPKPAIRIADLAGFAAQHFRDSLLRNSLTTLGVAVGVASLVAMLSLGVGLQQLATKRLTRSGLFDTVLVTSKEFDRGNRNGIRRNEPAEAVKPLDEQSRINILKLPNVLEVYPELRFLSELKVASQSHFVPVAALPMSSKDREVFDTMKGRFFSAPKAEEAILSGDFAKDLGETPQSLIGTEIILNYPQRMEGSGDQAADQLVSSGFSVNRKQQKFKVVGILDGDPDLGLRGNARARVYIPMELAQSMNIMMGSDLQQIVRTTATGGSTYIALTARVGTPAQVQAIEDAVKQMGFNAFSMLDASRSLRRFFTVVDLFLGIFGSLALVVASLGIVNTLVMAILERRHEIGIMKAVGASQADVRRLFFAEAGAIGLLGGLAGTLLGWGIGRVINAGTNAYLRSQSMNGETFWAVPWWLVLSGIVFAVVVSLAAGVYPASRAARLDPIQALRYE